MHSEVIIHLEQITGAWLTAMLTRQGRNLGQPPPNKWLRYSSASQPSAATA